MSNAFREWQLPILLGGYAAKQCPVRTQNDFSPVVPAVEWVPSAEVQANLDAGRQFEDEVFAELLRIHPDAAVLIDPRLRHTDAVDATLAAMRGGAPLVLGGWLPDDVAGGRKGRPDILVRFAGGYLPADVKNHKTIDGAKTVSKPVSSLAQPDLWWDATGVTKSSHYFEDGLQLAHYTRMLQACGFHPGPEWLFGAILGTSALAVPGMDPEHVFVWFDLAEPSRFTFSRSRGKVKRSLLERYDHEFGFRVKVAAVASQITGSTEDPEPLVVPIGQAECTDCPYALWCAEQMAPDDPSVAITRGRLDTREWMTLRGMGITTTEGLGDLDPDDAEFFDDYYPEVRHWTRKQATKRLREAVRRARMIGEGIYFEPKDEEPIEVPAADVEIDVDIEWDAAGRIYQWGIRTRDGQDDATARYAPVVSFEDLDDAGELALAEAFASRIVQLRSEAERAGRTVAVYHWHHIEVSMTRKFAAVAAALEGVSRDLLAWFDGTFHVQGGSSIKTIAHLFGFDWGVDDAGGRMSQLKVEAARGSGADAADAREWCLRYNESDVAAQAAIRDGLRAMYPRRSEP